MIKFDFTSVADSNGFIRLPNVNKFDKFIGIFRRMDTCVPSDYNETLYRDYSAKTHTANGVYDFAQMCPAEMFIKRIAKSLPTGYVMLSEFPNEESKNRVNRIVYIIRYGYCNTRRGYPQCLVIHYVDEVNSVISKKIISIDDLGELVFRFLNIEEIECYKSYVKMLGIKPTPIYKYMMMKQEYKDNYNLYLSDCERYNFKPLPKELIQNMNIYYDNKYEGIKEPVMMNPECVLGGFEYEDAIIVNK